MAEQSHRDEMNAAIRAQRERHAAPRTIAPAGDAAPVAPEPTEAAPGPAAQAMADPAQHEAAQPEAAPSSDAAPPRRSLLDRLRRR